MTIAARSRRPARASNRRVVLGRWSLRHWWRPRHPTAIIPRRGLGTTVAPCWMRRACAGAVGAVCGMLLAGALWQGGPRVFQAFKCHPYFAIARIEVEGNRRLQRQELLDWIGVQDGSSIWDAAANEVRLQLLAHPWVQRVTVRRRLPGQLKITVQERRPAAIVKWDGLKYVDRYGRVLGPLREEDSRDFPLITGLDDAASRDIATVGLHRALQLLRRCEHGIAFDTVSEVRVDQRRGLVLYGRHAAVAVVLGWGGWRDKLERAARTFAAWNGQLDRLAVVDVSFRNQVVVTVRQPERRPANSTGKSGMRI